MSTWQVARERNAHRYISSPSPILTKYRHRWHASESPHHSCYLLPVADVWMDDERARVALVMRWPRSIASCGGTEPRVGDSATRAVHIAWSLASPPLAVDARMKAAARSPRKTVHKSQENRWSFPFRVRWASSSSRTTDARPLPSVALHVAAGPVFRWNNGSVSRLQAQIMPTAAFFTMGPGPT